MSASTNDVERQLRRLFDAGSAVGLTDSQLLERFVARDSESAEAAFETILTRHGSTVLTVCRQVLGDVHAAEDAFQATFLVLVRRAGSLRIRDNASLGPWLYEVAYRTALKARQSAARRRAREHRVAVPEGRAGQGGADVAERRDLGIALHQEVNRLPAKYRVPVVLCYFEGRTHDEAAATLRWPVGTVRSNLSRARDLLRSRLTRRGLAPAGWIGASSIETIARAEVPAALRTATVAAAIWGTPAAIVAALTKAMLRSLLMARLKVAVGVALTMALLAAGVGFAMQDARRGQPLSTGPAPVAAHRPRPNPVDRLGDPLPRYARARLGNLRFRHGESVKEALYTSDGKSLVSVDGRDPARVWDVATGRLVREIGEAGIGFPEITISPDGKILATTEYPSRLRLWDLASGKERRRWHVAKDENYQHLRFSPDGRTVAADVFRYDEATKKEEKFLNLWDLTAPTERRRRIGGGDWLMLEDLQFSPDGKLLATASNDTESRIIGEKPEKGSTRLWDLATGRELRRFPVEGFHVRSVAFSPDGRLLAAGVTDQTIRIYDRTTGQERLPQLGQEHALQPRPPQREMPAIGNRDPLVMTCLAFSPDGTILASGSCGSGNTGESLLAAVYLWDVGRGQELRHFPAHQAGIKSLTFSPNGRTLATTGPEVVIRLWDVATGRETVPQSGHRSGIRKLVVSPADGTVFTAGQDGTIRRWDPASGHELGIFAAFAAEIDAMAFAPDGKTLLVGGLFGGLALWSVAERRDILRLARIEERNPIHYLVFAPDGKTVASERRIWDVASGKVLVTFQDRDRQNNRLANYYPIFYSPDGKQIITTEPGGVRVWEIASGKEARWVLRAEQFHFYEIALSPDGRFLARGGLAAPIRGTVDPSIRLVEVASGQEVVRLDGHEEHTRGLAFSPDGRLLASGSGSNITSRDATVRIWDLATSRERRRFDGHLAAVNAVAFTPDGRSVVSGSMDGTALVWDVSDLQGERPSDEPLTPDSLQSRWDELAGHDARAAYRTTWALSVLSAVGFLRDHLQAATTAEPITSPEVLRSQVRAITALERIHSPEARDMIERLSQGKPDAITTREAKSTLDRLRRAMGR